jgi:hypothetical protein
VFRSIFQKDSEPERPGRPSVKKQRYVPRHSSGWKALLDRLHGGEGLRVMDVGPTSPQNITLLTGLGHSVYMSDIVGDSLSGEFDLPAEEPGGEKRFNTEKYLEEESGFGARLFDVVLLWTTLDYIPEALVGPLVERVYARTAPGAQVLAMFHAKKSTENSHYCRYHLTETDAIEMQELEAHPVRRILTNRSIEQLFSRFSNYRFFLAKDNLYEVLITR